MLRWRHLFLAFLVCASLAPHAVLAGAVWRIAITDYQEPVPAEPASVWQQFSRWLMSRAIIRPPVGTTFTVNSSAYASSPYQTDSTPCITAAGTRVRPGTAATNFLPMGTILKVHNELYIVEDRMNPRYRGYYLDLWFSSTSEALQFGRRRMQIEIVGYGTPGQELRRAGVAAAQDEEITADAMVEEPSLFERVNLRFIATSRRLSKFITTNVNRHDVDCFAETTDTTTP